jgi:hypothetical protein
MFENLRFEREFLVKKLKELYPVKVLNKLTLCFKLKFNHLEELFKLKNVEELLESA